MPGHGKNLIFTTLEFLSSNCCTILSVADYNQFNQTVREVKLDFLQTRRQLLNPDGKDEQDFRNDDDGK